MSSCSTSCLGASSPATLTELVAIGAADAYLTADPTITFFRFRYNKYTNFAMEAINQTFQSQVSFGSETQLTLNRTGDLIYYQYVVIDLPGIRAVPNPGNLCGVGGIQFPCMDLDLDNPNAMCDPCGDGQPPVPWPANCCSSEEPDSNDDDPFNVPNFLDGFDSCTGLPHPFCHYTDAIGQYLVRRACLVIGGQVIDTVYNDFMFMWEELAGKVGARLTEMIGKRFTRAQLVADSLYDRRLWVPLPFSYTRTAGNALPLVSLQFHGVQISVSFERLVKCIVVSDCNALVLKTNSCQAISQNDMQAMLETTYIYLDILERDRFAVGAFEQLITQVQCFSTIINKSQAQLTLNFNHPTIELIWAVRRQCQEDMNNHFNFSGKYGRDPVLSASLRFNNQSRFAGQPGPYFRLVQPYQHHSNIPDGYIYCYSFALNPEDAQPSGSVNLSRIDSCELLLDLQPEMFDNNGNVTVMVFARNWNVLRFRQGLAGIAFSS